MPLRETDTVILNIQDLIPSQKLNTKLDVFRSPPLMAGAAININQAELLRDRGTNVPEKIGIHTYGWEGNLSGQRRQRVTSRALRSAIARRR